MLWMLPIALLAQSTDGGDKDPWLQFGYTDSFAAFINPSTARVLPDGTVVVWVEYRMTVPEKDGTVRNLALDGFDCQNVTVSTRAITSYDRAGKVIFARTYAAYERTPQEITPGSIIDTAFKVACNKPL